MPQRDFPNYLLHYEVTGSNSLDHTVYIIQAKLHLQYCVQFYSLKLDEQGFHLFLPRNIYFWEIALSAGWKG